MPNRFDSQTGYGDEPDFNALVVSENNRVEGTGLFPLAAEKQAPNDLSEYINHSDIPAGSTIMVVDEVRNGIVTQITNRFFLTNFNVNYREKAQLVETFGASTVSFFGDTIKVYQFSGRAVDYPSTSNAASSMSQTALIKLYDEHLRGTKLLQNKRIGVIKIFNHTVYGYPLSFNVSYNSSADKMASFTMSWVVAKHDYAIPGLIEDQDIADTYDPVNVILQDDETKARLNRIQEFIGIYEQSMTYESREFSSFSSSPYSGYEASAASFMLDYQLARLQGISGETIRRRIEDIILPGIALNAEDKEERIEKGFDLLEERFSTIVDYLIGLAGQVELPPRFEISTLKDLKSSLSSLDQPRSLEMLVSFAKELNGYVRTLRKSERIIKQGI